MPGDPVKLGPFVGGMHNSSGNGEFIADDELFDLTNLEVDYDGSLANRPQINLYSITGFNTAGCSLLGTYLPNDGRRFLVVFSPVTNQVFLVDVATGAASGTATPTGLVSVCCIQFSNKLFVVATNASAVVGGYFDAPTVSTLSWTALSNMARGEAIVQYRDRLFIACGLGATTNTSRVSYSAVTDPTLWTGIDSGFMDVATGNGQKLVSLVRLGSDIVLFKEHSTHKLTYTSNVLKFEITEIDATIGVVGINSVVVYNNNTVYSLHDNAVYELYQYTYNKISIPINLVPDSDLDLYSKDQFGVTVHRDRLFVRYFKYLYVYSLKIKKWCQWVTDRKFSKIVVMPSLTVGLDTAYAATASQNKSTEVYSFQDTRKVDFSGNTTLSAITVPLSAQFSGTAASSVLTVPATPAVGDWIYVFHSHQNGNYGTVDVQPPVGWQEVLPYTLAGDTVVRGTEAKIWRKKWAVGETTYTWTLPRSVPFRQQLLVVRGSDSFTLGPVTAALDSVYRDKTIPAFTSTSKALVLSFWAVSQGAGGGNVGTTLIGSTKILDSPVAGTATGVYSTTGSTLLGTDGEFAGSSLASAGSITDCWVSAAIALLPRTGAIPTNSEVFQGKITTKTYDFDLPHSYKVLFWWGLSVATSGKFGAAINIPNAQRNFTYRQIYNLYGNWAAAQAANIKWSNNSDIVIPETVIPTLGGYARKFIKMLKKIRYRQIFWTLVFDIVTNNGVADASLRVYDLTAFMKKKETVVRETS